MHHDKECEIFNFSKCPKFEDHYTHTRLFFATAVFVCLFLSCFFHDSGILMMGSLWKLRFVVQLRVTAFDVIASAGNLKP